MTVSTVNSETVLKTVSDAVTLFAFTVVKRVFKALLLFLLWLFLKKVKRFQMLLPFSMASILRVY